MVKSMDKIIAHRGIYNNKIKENTYLAIFNAFNNKYIYGVEFDIRLTKDNKIVVIHDKTINRTSNRIGIVENMTLKELQKYNFGSKNFYQVIPTLEKILEINTNKLFLIEIKVSNNIKLFSKIILNILNKYKNKKIYLMSFNKDILNIIRSNNKNLNIGLIYLTNNIKSYKYNFYVLYDKFINKNLINNLLNRNKEVFIWTINNYKEFNNIKKRINNYDQIYYIANIKEDYFLSK